MNNSKDIYEKAKNEILQARQPFDTTLQALEEMKKNRDYILQQFMEVCKYMNPEYEQLAGIRDMFKEGKVPQIWHLPESNELRIFGSKNTNWIDFLKENSKA